MNNYYQIIENFYLDSFIKEKQNSYLNEIKLESDKGSTYNTYYDISYYKNIASIHFTIFVYSGGAHDIRFDKVYYYDINQNEELKLNDIIDDMNDFFLLISKLSYNYLTSEFQDAIYKEKEMLIDGLKPDLEHFQYIIFDLNGINIIFPPYQVGPWSSGEIVVPIKYQDIDKYLKI